MQIYYRRTYFDKLRLFRESRGEKAYTIVESDNRLPEDITEKLLENPNVQDVMLIQP